MAYNSNSINSFIERVNKEAEKAAQQVFDKYQEEFETRVKNQMLPGDTLILSMGSGYFKNKEFGVAEKFISAVSDIQYLEQRASFEKCYEFEK